MDAVQKYRLNRIRRMELKYGKYHGPLARFDDDDDETNNNNGNSSHGGHGNTRIPFGLCEREGIDIGKGWTPKDAWNALEGKGISAGSIYKQLRTTGKVSGVGKQAKTKRPPTQIKDSDFPPSMVSKAVKKNTMVAADYINSHCDDGDITDFLASATGSGAGTLGSLTCKRVKDGRGCSVSTTISRASGEPISSEMSVPMFSAYDDESEKAQAIRSFAHEWTHYLDAISRDGKKYEHFTAQHKELNDLLDKEEQEVKVGEEAQKHLDAFKARYLELKEECKKAKKARRRELAHEIFGEKIPNCISEEGGISFFTHSYLENLLKVEEYEKKVRKVDREVYKDYDKKYRAALDGVSTLGGIYDSIYSGRCMEQGITVYGHSTGYFRKDRGNRASEALADYVALKATNPKLAQVFINDKPHIAEAMDKVIVEMTKKLRGQ